MKPAIWIVFVILFSSCTSHYGTMSGGSAVITNNKFASVQFAYGTASAFTFLGIGGNNKDALVLEAKRNLYLNSLLLFLL